MSDGTLSQEEIDELLAMADEAMGADYELNVNFEYDIKELEKIKNMLIELGKILPEIITEKFLNKVVEKWVKKYLKIYLGKMIESKTTPKKYRLKSDDPLHIIHYETMEINESTEAEVIKWAGRDVVIRSPVLEPTDDYPLGIYWQIKSGIYCSGICISGDYIIKDSNGVFYSCPRKEYHEKFEPLEE